MPHTADESHPSIAAQKRHVFARTLAACLMGGLAVIPLSGCGGGGASFVQPSLTLSTSLSTACSVAATAATSSGEAPTITPASTSITMYPGQTLTLPVAITAPASAGPQLVTLGANSLPDGLTLPSITGKAGTTANLTLAASTTIATSCFTGATNGVDSVTVPLMLEARSSTGDTQVPVSLTILLENPSFSPSTTDLPVLSITTADSAAITSIDTYVGASVTIADSTHPSNIYTGSGEIRGHGNSTWLMPKKPYKIKLDAKASILGMKPAKDWILLANYDDKTMLRTALAFHISETMGMFWTPSTQFAEVYLNGSYQGTYQVSEEVEIDSNRLDIPEVSTTSNSGDALTGGYLLEIDGYRNNTFTTTSPKGLPIGAQDPNPPTSAQESYLTGAIATAEDALYDASYTNASTGWPAFFDQASAVNWYITEELMGNQDADFWSSDFFYKLENDQHFYMGPVWDFDVSSGNINESPAVDPNLDWVRVKALWYQQLFSDPAFLAAVKARWTAVRPELNDLPTFLNTNAANLATAQANNYARWPTLGEKIWPNAETAGTYQGEVNYLNTWMTQRLAYMDSLYLNQ